MKYSIDTFLKKIRPKIDQFVKKGTNEAQTINYLIMPFFESLGWDFTNPDEVVPQESDEGGKVPDFTFYVNKKPKLLVEAKSISNTLDDKKMITEKVNYCLNSGIELLIITNGIDYKLYYSRLKGPSKDKKLHEFNIAGTINTDITNKLTKNSFENDELIQYAQNVSVLGSIKNAIQILLQDPNQIIIDQINYKLKESLGHKFHDAEIKNNLKHFSINLDVDFLEMNEQLDDRNNVDIDSPKKWTIENQFRDGKWKNSLKLYKKLISELNNSKLNLKESPTKRYIGLINQTSKVNFIQVNGQQSKLRIWLKLSMEDLTEEEKLVTRDVTKIGHWGMGNIEMIINNESNFEWAIPIIKKAYNK